MRIIWDDRAWEEYLYWEQQDKKTLKKINRLIADIERNCYQSIGKPEPLTGNYVVLYYIEGDEVTITDVLYGASDIESRLRD